MRVSRLAFVLLVVLICGSEWQVRRGDDRWTGTHGSIYVIGDSLSAGAGDAVTPWPVRLGEQGYRVANLAQPGATARSALEQARQVVDSTENCLVLIEIGGNDLLSGRTAASFESDLRVLLQALRPSRRTLVMFELPLLPGAFRYGQAQRRLAREFDVALIPKRVLTSAIAGPGRTVDGLHLSHAGHQWLADWMAHRLSAGP